MKRIGRNARVENIKGREYVNVVYEIPKQENQKEILLEKRMLQKNDYIVIQGGEIKHPSKNWKENMMRYFLEQSDSNKIGMVCGKLIKGNRVLSCGYTYDENGNVYPLFRGLKVYYKGYFRRAVVPQNVSIGTLDFCVIDRAVYQKVGGFDTRLPSPYRDLDFAFRLREAGYRILIDPSIRARCIVERQTEEEDARKARRILNKRWNSYLVEGDPYYNPNFAKGQETFCLNVKEENV